MRQAPSFPLREGPGLLHRWGSISPRPLLWEAPWWAIPTVCLDGQQTWDPPAMPALIGGFGVCLQDPTGECRGAQQPTSPEMLSVKLGVSVTLAASRTLASYRRDSGDGRLHYRPVRQPCVPLPRNWWNLQNTKCTILTSFKHAAWEC